jgi:hypothetical protein
MISERPDRWPELKRLTCIADTQVPPDGPQMVESGDGGRSTIGAVGLSQRDP